MGGNPVNWNDPNGLTARQIGNWLDTQATSYVSSLGDAAVQRFGDPSTWPAQGAAYGGAAGGIVGAWSGGAGGAAGGTLVAPGVGTVGGAYSGAVAGAAQGTVLGAAGGALIGTTAADLYYLSKSSGTGGVDPLHHNANVTVRDVEGNIIRQDRFVSGNMTPDEKALGFPKNTLASHTEARAVTNIPLEEGQTMTITGQRPPCPSCKGYMNRAAQESGATIEYQWRDNGVTRRWVAGGK